MTARTTALRYVLAQATVRAGLPHLAAERTTGTYFAVCGAGQIRSREITTWTTAPADLLTTLCEGCAALAASLGGTVEAGVALFVGSEHAASTAQLTALPLDAVHLPAGRPQRDVDEALAALADSIRAHGVLQPILVRRTSAGLELVAGARRLIAARAAGLDRIPAVVTEHDDGGAVVAALVENLHRADLNPIEQAHAYEHALAALHVTKEALATLLSVSRAQVSNTIRLLALPTHLRAQVAAGALSAAHGRALLRVTEPAEQDALAERITAEGLTTRDADAAARRTAAAPRDARLDDVARMLTGLLDAQVRVTTSAERARVVIDVPEADLPRILAQLGVHATAVAA